MGEAEQKAADLIKQGFVTPDHLIDSAAPLYPKKKLSLPDVTLVMVDTRCHELAALAVDDCVRQAHFGRVLICSDRPLPTKAPKEGPTQIADFVRIKDAPSKLAWARWLWEEMPRLVRTRQALLIQWDSWIINPAAWRDEFLTYDYVGAPWWYEDGLNVGNSGFSLRSKRLMDFLVEKRDRFPCTTDAEDDLLSRRYRRQLEAEGGFRWAPENVAHEFAFECARPTGHNFGFHAMRNWPHVLDRDALIARARVAARTPMACSRSHLGQLLQVAPWLRAEIAA